VYWGTCKAGPNSETQRWAQLKKEPNNQDSGPMFSVSWDTPTGSGPCGTADNINMSNMTVDSLRLFYGWSYMFHLSSFWGVPRQAVIQLWTSGTSARTRLGTTTPLNYAQSVLTQVRSTPPTRTAYLSQYIMQGVTKVDVQWSPFHSGTTGNASVSDHCGPIKDAYCVLRTENIFVCWCCSSYIPAAALRQCNTTRHRPCRLTVAYRDP